MRGEGIKSAPSALRISGLLERALILSAPHGDRSARIEARCVPLSHSFYWAGELPFRLAGMRIGRREIGCRPQFVRTHCRAPSFRPRRIISSLPVTREEASRLGAALKPRPKPTLVRVVLFRIGRIVEQHGQLDTTVPKLRKIGRAAISWIEIGSCIVRRKQDQRVQEFL